MAKHGIAKALYGIDQRRGKAKLGTAQQWRGKARYSRAKAKFSMAKQSIGKAKISTALAPFSFAMLGLS